MKVGFYLSRPLIEKLRDVAWFDRKPASRIVSTLLEEYLRGRRVPSRPKESDSSR